MSKRSCILYLATSLSVGARVSVSYQYWNANIANKQNMNILHETNLAAQIARVTLLVLLK
jgi:hypothetical protein